MIYRMSPRIAVDRLASQRVSLPKVPEHLPNSEYLLKKMCVLKDIAHIMFAVTWNVKCLFV